MSSLQTYVLPVYWASYLINGDSSGMDRADLIACNDWLNARKLRRDYFCDVSESWFARANDATSLGGDVAEFSYQP